MEEEGREGGRYEMYIFFLYLGFNLLNISKTAAFNSSVCVCVGVVLFCQQLHQRQNGSC